jgi:hypothetical protein
MEYNIKKTPKGVSQKKLEGYLKLANIIQWGRRNPIKFIETFYGVHLLDYQKYAFMNTWITPNSVWLFSRNGAKTTMGGIFVMAKANLIPKYRAYILSGTGQQAQELFMKIEDIAKKNIATFTGLTDIFFNETVKSAACTTGFTHNPVSFGFDLYNGSKVRTLNSDEDNNRGKRSNLNYYDEAGYIPENFYSATEPFLAQNSNFSLGGEKTADLMPRQFPNQKIYASSASSIDTYFFSKYKEYAKRMFMGDKNFFVADINCDVIINATFNGKLYPVPLLERREVDDALKQSQEKGLREYFNKFTVEGGDNQIVKRASIVKNSDSYAPILANNNSGNKFGLAYDPAHDWDNSIVLAGEFVEDDKIGTYLKICNCTSFLDVGKKKRKSLRTPEQVEHVKSMILDYNGLKSADYENLEILLVDSGAGGGGHIIGDYFMEDWKDSKGSTHKGLIDKEESSDYVSKFPNAIDKIKLVNPKRYKNEMFAALEDMVKMDLIKFPRGYDLKDFIYISRDKFEEGYIETDDGDKIKKGERELIKYNLSMDEKLSLTQIEIMKEEIVNIYRNESSNGGVTYGLSKDKACKMHDDRAYCLAMLAWHLQKIRRKHITGKPKKNTNISQYMCYN